MDTFWAHSAQSQWPSSPTVLTYASRVIRRWQIQIYGDPYPCPPRARRRPQTSFPLQRKLRQPRFFADLLQWLDPPEAVLKRLGRLVGDQERNESSYSSAKFDIRERRQMLGKCQLVMATGGTVSQDLVRRTAGIVLHWALHGRDLLRFVVHLQSIVRGAEPEPG